MIVTVYRSHHGDCTGGGISSAARHLCVVNVDGGFEPHPDSPAALLVCTPSIHLVPAVEVSTGMWMPMKAPQGSVGPMHGGNLADSADSRWYRAIRELMAHMNDGHMPVGYSTAVSIHDRFETVEQYAMLSR
jgi:hypothetical protein